LIVVGDYLARCYRIAGDSRAGRQILLRYLANIRRFLFFLLRHMVAQRTNAGFSILTGRIGR
jgi:hypothetical protein